MPTAPDRGLDLGTAEWSALSQPERVQFDRDGYVIVPDALSGAEVQRARSAVGSAYAKARSAGRLNTTHAMHELSAVTTAPGLAFLIDHPSTLRYVWSLLGWNVHVYHSHVDVHPPVGDSQQPWWHWHQDGGRQNRELETDPRPRLSVKVAFWLSDVSKIGRGNLTVIPGSHRQNWLDGPPRRDVPWPAPPDAVQVCVRPGDAIVFDRRLWHARSDNRSTVTRMATFFGYTYRWIAIRDEVTAAPQQDWWHDLTPVQQQLLGQCGDGSGDHAWGHDPLSVPLYRELAEQGLLDPDFAPLKP
jgi:ectoine hydroxylase